MSDIGQWMGRKGQKNHHVQSEIETRVVTKCGRQMERRHPSGELTVEGGTEACYYCRAAAYR